MLPRTIQININDNGNTGTGGGSDVDLGTVNIDITAVNDAPVFDSGTSTAPTFNADTNTIYDNSAINGPAAVITVDLDGDGATTSRAPRRAS